MKVFKSSKSKISGTSFSEVRESADRTYRSIKARTKRTPYIKSKYFKGEKVFLTIFWSHLFEKQEKDRTRRLKFYNCAVDLIRNSTFNPITRENFQKKDEILHRFSGKSKDGGGFIVQIKENKRTKRKDFISVYLE